MSNTLTTDLNALRTGSGVALLGDRALLRISGPDSARWLNGMVTNSVIALQPGEGAYTFLLNAQGRIQGDGVVYREASSAVSSSAGAETASFLFSTTAAQLEVLEPWLERYVIMDDVELHRVHVDEPTLLVMGALAEETLRTRALPLPEPLRLLRVDSSEGPVLLSTPAPGLTPRVELRASAGILSDLQQRFLAVGAVELAPASLEAWRVLEGAPLFGVDIRDRDLPQETAQGHALHFAKGCYLGQEIVERIRSRGQVHRVFTPLELTGDSPETLPAPIEWNGKAAGEITSMAEVPAAGRAVLLALGYVRREALAAGTPLPYPGGTALPRTAAGPTTA